MKQRNAGFTLIEVLVAMSLFAIASLAITQLMVNHTAMVARNDAGSQAITFAQQEMEHLRTMQFADMASGSDTYTDAEGKEFNVAWDVTLDTPADDMNHVLVTVSWDEKGETKSYELENIFTKVANNG
jgi:type II secretion system protein I